MMEWRPIDDFYQVSNCGLVARNDGRIVGQWLNSLGYPTVRLNNPRRQERVHRLVAAAFCANPDGKPFVNHINNVRSDNRAENLEWCTQRENLAHADRQGRMQRNYWVGKRSPSARLTDSAAQKIREDYAKGGASFSSLAHSNGVSKRTIGRIINGEHYV